MPITMTHKDWKDDTYRFARKRGERLQQVDAALKTYLDGGRTPEALRTLKNAFYAWIAEKGNSGLDSCRNHKNAVAHLKEQIDATMLATNGIGQVLAQASRTPVLHAHRVAPSSTATAKTMTDNDMVSAFTDRVRTLWTATNWDGKTKKQRGEALIAAVTHVHTACAVPTVTPDVRALAIGYNGFFDFATWSIQLAEDLFDFAFGAGNRQQLIDVAETVYHEARHCEQWFHMARFYALGKTATDIRTQLGIGRQSVCDEAKRRQMTADDKMMDLTREWFRSVYGDSSREITLRALGLNRVQNTPRATNMDEFHTNIHQAYSGDLPEERDAWAIQLLVRAKLALPSRPPPPRPPPRRA